jgi:putative ABC transport system ATP-binding protein
MGDMIVEVQDVKKIYKLGATSVPALQGVTLGLRKGEFTALVGTSGSGKSTLLNLIGCIDEPDAGRVAIEGIDVASLSDDKRSQLRNEKIGFIFQSFNLVPVLTVFENVELPLLINDRIPASERQGRVESAIADVGLQEVARQLPDRLSGGQRQRVAIARALVTDPVLVLADEPTANLDSTTAHRILDLMISMNERRKVTFFFSTHDEKLMARVARIVRISDGTITA